MPNQRGMSTIVFLIVIIVILIVFAGGGWFGYTKFIRKNAKKSLTSVKIKEEILSFTLQRIPDLYNLVINLDDNIFVIDEEISRLDKIAKKFPDQQAIVSIEKSEINAIRKDLETVLTEISKEMEHFYVSYLVNKKKGEGLIKKKNKTLKKKIIDSLKTSNTLVTRLQTKKKWW